MHVLSRFAVLALAALVLAACQTTTTGPTPQLAKRFDPALWRPEPYPTRFLKPGVTVDSALMCQRPRCPMNGLIVVGTVQPQPADAAVLRGDFSDAAIREVALAAFKRDAGREGSTVFVRKAVVSRGRGWVQVDHQGEGITREGAMGIYLNRARMDAKGTKLILVIADNLADARRIFSQAAGAF